MSERQDKDDSERLQKAIDTLGEFYDAVQIFANRHEPEHGGTIFSSRGVGNWYSRYGQVKTWIISEEERTKEDLRRSMEEEEE